MIITIVFIILGLIIFLAIKSSKKVDYAQSDNNTQKLKVIFPHPEKTNDYKYYKFIESTSKLIIEPLLPEFKRQGIKLKPEYEKAILQKIKTGEFKNPYDFKSYYGTNFDFIGVQFLKGADSLLSAFHIGVYFIQNGKVADSETYEFCPPSKITKTKKFKETLELFDFDLEMINAFSFNDVWNTFELKEYFNTNLIVFWDEEAEILKQVLSYNKIADSSISYIKIREIAVDNNLPDSIDSLLEYFKSDLTFKDDLALIVASLSLDIKEHGIEVGQYIHELDLNSKIDDKPETTKTKVQNNSSDFVAIDVETAQGKRWSICQIGITEVVGGEIRETITELIQPPDNKYLKGNINIHGITPEMTEHKPTFPEIWEKICQRIENKKLVAHNANFDIDCLKQTLNYYNINIPHFDYDCTYKGSGMTLDEACEAYNIELKHHHHAGCDSEACAKLCLKLRNGEIPNKVIRKSTPKVRYNQTHEGHDKLKGDILKPDLENADSNSPFYNKKVVFTGVLEKISRLHAAEIIKKMGADIDTGITKRTDFVVTGLNPGPSKMNKIIKYNNDGCNIKVLYEKEFLNMIETE